MTSRSRDTYYGKEINGNDLKRVINARLIQETGYIKDCLSPTNSLLDKSEHWQYKNEDRPFLQLTDRTVNYGWIDPIVFEVPPEAARWTLETDVQRLKALAIQQKNEDKATAFIDSLKMLIGGMLGYTVHETARQYSTYQGTVVELKAEDVEIRIRVPK